MLLAVKQAIKERGGPSTASAHAAALMGSLSQVQPSCLGSLKTKRSASFTRLSLAAICLPGKQHHPGGNPGANLKSISHRCHPILVAFVWELTKETIYLPLGCLQGGEADGLPLLDRRRTRTRARRWCTCSRTRSGCSRWWCCAPSSLRSPKSSPARCGTPTLESSS